VEEAARLMAARKLRDRKGGARDQIDTSKARPQLHTTSNQTPPSAVLPPPIGSFHYDSING
jgi:hypothetical protein